MISTPLELPLEAALARIGCTLGSRITAEQIRTQAEADALRPGAMTPEHIRQLQHPGYTPSITMDRMSVAEDQRVGMVRLYSAYLEEQLTKCQRMVANDVVPLFLREASYRGWGVEYRVSPEEYWKPEQPNPTPGQQGIGAEWVTITYSQTTLSITIHIGKETKGKTDVSLYYPDTLAETCTLLGKNAAYWHNAFSALHGKDYEPQVIARTVADFIGGVT